MTHSDQSKWEAFGTVEELKSAFGVPSQAIFVGYVVWLRQSDEFLVSLQKFPQKWHNGSAVGFAWTSYPAHAKVFSDHREAFRVAAEYDKARAEVVHLFDLEDKLLVVSDV